MAESKNLERYAARSVGLPRVATLGLALAAIVLIGFLLRGSPTLPGNLDAKSGALQSTATPQAAPDEAFKQLRATEDAVLNTYGWVDRESGIVHIPIERAMELLLQRGLPARPPDQQPTQEF
jgi:hypothetical protein